MMNVETAMMNDLGEYRIFGVPAGRYKMRAILSNYAPFNSGEQEEFAPTYYRGQPDGAGAASIDLRARQTLRGVDMVALRTATRRVQGTVMAVSGRGDVIQVTVSSRDPSSFLWSAPGPYFVPTSRNSIPTRARRI